MKEIKKILKKTWETLKKRRALLFILAVVLLIVVNSLFYLFTGNNLFTSNSSTYGTGQTQNGEFYDPTKEQYENESNDLVDNLPYESINFTVGAARPDADGTNIIIVGLSTNPESRVEFREWLDEYSYNEASTKFVFYEKP